ncbi:MAG TPA: DUF1735 domain-containing protein [Chitinophagaceae bacterium]|nr:DUF1735 domain-containing protein [Chitinophagaceae bacterium]
MKNKIFKYISHSAVAFTVLFFASCVKKNEKTFTDFSDLTDMVILQNSGLANFSGYANVVITPSSPDTIRLDIYAGLASVYTGSSDITVTLAIDDAKRTAYNTANNTNYNAFTSNMFKLLSNSVVIKAGQRYAKTTLEIYKDSVDLSESWMVPISITDASGKKLSSNQNTLYFHVIGNPLAGDYTWDFYRWNNGTGTGTQTGSFSGEVASFLPVSATTIEVQSGYFIGPSYQLSFDFNGGVYSNFKVIMKPEDVQALLANDVSIVDGPNILLADPIAGHFTFQYIVWNGSANRYLIDDYYK